MKTPDFAQAPEEVAMQQQSVLDQTTVVEVRREINRLLEKLTPESLLTMRQFAAFLQTQQQSEQSHRLMDKKNGGSKANSSSIRDTNLHAWTGVPAADVMKLTSVLPQGYDGDSLIDTEAIYDEE